MAMPDVPTLPTAGGLAIGDTVSTGVILMTWYSVFAGIPWLAIVAAPGSIAAFIWYVLQISRDQHIQKFLHERRQHKINHLKARLAGLEKAQQLSGVDSTFKSTPQK